MPLSKRHHYIQVVLETIDHLWHHQITGLVILQWEEGDHVCLIMHVCARWVQGLDLRTWKRK